MPTARHALCPVVRVHADERPPAPPAGETVYAVFTPDDDPSGGGRFLGLVTPGQTAAYRERIFADLLPRPAPAAVAAHTPLNDVVAHLDREKADAVAVLEEGGAFLGAVTRASLLDALLQGEPKPTIAAAPIEGLHAASLRLLSLLVLDEAEQDLLQPAIEILTSLLKARYGAIGIVDEHGQLLRFVHTGIAPELAARIGRLPEGRGLLGVVIHENHALRLENMSQDPRSVGFPPHHPRMKNLLAVPVSREGHVFGRMYFSDRLDGAPFSADDERLAAQAADVLGLTLSHHRLQNERRQAADTLHDIAQVLSANTGESLFHKLVLSLAKALGVDYAFVGEVSPHHAEIIQTIAFCDHGRIVDNIEYQLTPATACGSVGGKAVCYFPEGVRALYPEDEILREFQAETFIGHPLLDASGGVLGLLAIMHRGPLANPAQAQSILQISSARAVAELERQHAERALRESEEDLRALAENANDGILINSSGKHVFANQRLADMLGYTLEELRQTSMKELVHPDEYDKVASRFRARLAGEAVPPNYETVFVTKDGAALPVELNAAKTVWQGQPAGLVFVRDITARKQTEAEMRKLASAVEQTADSVLVTDANGVIEYVNPGYEKTTGYTLAEVAGKNPNVVKSGQHDRAFYEHLWSTIRRGEPFRGIFVNRRKNGELYYEAKTISPLKNKRGEITHFVSTGKDISERVHAERTLREQEERFRQLTENINQVFWMTSVDKNQMLYVSPAYEKIWGRPCERLYQAPRDWLEAIHPDDRARVLKAALTRQAAGAYREEYRIVRPDGTVRWILDRAFPVHNEAGEVYRIAGIAADITARKQTDNQIVRLGRILDNSSNEIYVFDAESLRFLQVNQGAQRNLGYTIDEFGSLTPLDLDPEFTHESFEGLLAPLRRGEQEHIDFTTVYRRKDGSDYPVDVQLQLMRHETPPVFVAITQDITERKQTEARLSYLAFYDTLTGLPNRARLLERLQQAMLDAERVDRLVAVMFLDLDRFKVINDTLGHHVGDGLLKAVAERLKGCVRPGDIIARLGGDEFTVVLASVAHVDDVARVARKILESFSEPFRVESHTLFTTTSIGITLYPFDELKAEGLLKNADTAMYHAKEHGRNNFQFFTVALNVRAERRLKIETALRAALERNELSLHYQPQVDTKTGRITGMESLARWHHPELGNVSPMEFIPIAEETGLILPLGEWVLREACRQIRAWHQTGFPKLQVAVNISGKQLRQKDFPNLVHEVLKATGLEARYLDLELTESLLMEDVEQNTDAMHVLHDLGVSFSVDDFGTGYSSLAYLKRFPIDILKIDRSFVRDIASDPNNVAIVKTIIAMAHTLGMKVVGEGVETREQLEFLRAQDCDGSQGYYCSPPLSVQEFSDLLADWQHIRADRCKFAREAPRAARSRRPAKGKSRDRLRK